ncbi:hypothetical protein WICMUC_005190 [Wickerhamomyces mucosus]|uniref:glutathione transferase n=1 Tax=Wickerhamomyces mucosus TaxID=1378264 RepID=A0A9P8P9S1_9ASCO|nr:hypothetical protein WICMUC_005190 [Wickerhamomyces mucosus]
MSDNKSPIITLHWLEKSRSQRILWLLEELQIDYKLKLYHRDHSQRAPEELAKIFPLGKSPVVEIDYQDGKESRKIAESGFIIKYLIENFDKDGKLTPKNKQDTDDIDYYLFFTESSLQPYLTALIVHKVAVSKAPFFARPICSQFAHKIDESYNAKEAIIGFKFLEEKLKETNGEEFFVGNKISGADIILSFPIEIAFESERLQDLGFHPTEYPLLDKYLKSLKSRAAYKNAIKRIEVEGNGEFKISAT